MWPAWADPIWSFLQGNHRNSLIWCDCLNQHPLSCHHPNTARVEKTWVHLKVRIVLRSVWSGLLLSYHLGKSFVFSPACVTAIFVKCILVKRIFSLQSNSDTETIKSSVQCDQVWWSPHSCRNFLTQSSTCRRYGQEAKLVPPALPRTGFPSKRLGTL